jgi:quinol monooxygenase YgiN
MARCEPRRRRETTVALQDQPAYIIKMRAKPGQGDRLFELATAGMEKSNASDRFTILREDGDPDVLWNVEVFRSDEAKAAYEDGPLADELRDEIIGLLAEPPMRIPVHPYSALPPDPA